MTFEFDWTLIILRILRLIFSVSFQSGAKCGVSVRLMRKKQKPPVVLDKAAETGIIKNRRALLQAVDPR